MVLLSEIVYGNTSRLPTHVFCVTAITVTPDLEVDVVRDTLSLIQGLGDVDVSYVGDCKAFTYTVTMATKAGDQPEMTVNIFFFITMHLDLYV